MICEAMKMQAEPSPTMNGSLANRDMLCFSHDWTGDPLSKTHIMRLLAQNNRVLWVNSIGYRAPQATRKDLGRIFRKLSAAIQPVQEVEPNIFVLNPLAIPAWGSPCIRRMNASLLAAQVRRAMRKLQFREPINWVFNPAAGIVAGRLGEERVIYYCVDEYTAFSGVQTKAIASIEKSLLERADLVIVSAQKLLETKQSANAKTVLVRHGVDYDHFQKALQASTVIPAAIQGLPRPIIGYFGLISEDWVDVPLLINVARAFPEASLVMLGKVAMDVSDLAAEPNVHLLGRQPYDSLPSFCKGFDVAIIPFPITEVTLNANPLKAREYLAAGLPVISTAIPEVEVLGQCRIGATTEQFISQIREAMKSPGPLASRSSTMRQESWASRLDDIRCHYARIGSHTG